MGEGRHREGTPPCQSISSCGPHVDTSGTVTSQAEAEATPNRGNRAFSTRQQPPPCPSGLLTRELSFLPSHAICSPGEYGPRVHLLQRVT